jgi:DNA-binding Lrp family transcriptional regulator
LDMSILRAMGTGPFEHGPRAPDALTAAALAAKVGSTRQTVQERIARMEAAGIIEGYEIYPNLRHLGMQWSVFHWRVEDARVRSRMLDQIEPMDGVEGVYTFVSPDVCVALYWHNEAELQRKLKMVGALSNDRPTFTLYRRQTPPVPRPLSGLDWRIIRALRGNARRSLSAVAQDVGVSSKTVRRRFERMAREDAFDIVPVVALEKVTGAIPVAMLVHFEPDAGKAASDGLLAVFNDRCISAWVPPSPELGNLDLTLYADSSGQVASLQKQALQVAGVARVEVLLFAEGRSQPDWLNEAIDREIAKSVVSA